jgi:tetratricopeptide (TPR) repeat protein
MPEVISLFKKIGRESDFSTGMNPYSVICGHCGVALGVLGRFEEGKAYLEKALGNAIRLGDPATLWFTQTWYGWFFVTKGDFEAAKERLEKCLAHAEEANLHGLASASLCILGYVHSLLGDPEADRRQAEEGLRMYRESGVEYLLSFFHWMMGSIHLELSGL